MTTETTKTPVAIGKRAPEIKLESDGGDVVKLSALKGKFVVVYFYPKDNTPGCTLEAQDFKAAAKKFKAKNAVVLGISKDSIKSHCSFRDKYELNFPLLSDPDLDAHKAYGVYGEKMMYGKKILGTIRSTFVVTPEGKIGAIFSPVKVKGHVDAVLDAITELSKA